MATLAIFRPPRTVKWRYRLRHFGIVRLVTCASSTNKKRSGEFPYLVMCPSRRRSPLESELSPNHEKAHYHLGVMLDQKGDATENGVLADATWDKAIAQFREAIRLSPDYSEAHRGLCGVLKKKTYDDEALSECRVAVRLR